MDASKKTVLLVVHEASLTGAPVLGLNIARCLRPKFNVIVLSLGGGTIEKEFERVANNVFTLDERLRFQSEALDYVIKAITKQTPVDYAVVNSVCSSAVLAPLATRNIPSVILIHEFQAYSRPSDMIPNAIMWAGHTVFSAAVVMQDTLSAFPNLNGSAFSILPQGRCEPIGYGNDVGAEEEGRRITKLMRPGSMPPDTKVVVGLGFVQLRKGVDLFIACAKRMVDLAPSMPLRFVWIGNGYDTERELAYSVYLTDQIKRSRLEDKLLIMGAVKDIQTAYANTDLFLLTSRLDPLPNVAIDALSEGIPLLCFDRASGIADVLTERGLAARYVVPYLDVEAMARRAVETLSKHTGSASDREEQRRLAASAFNMDTYVKAVVNIVQGQTKLLEREKRDLQIIKNSPLFDPYFSYRIEDTPEMRSNTGIRYLRSWRVNYLLRKPCPGFDPAEYRRGALFANEDSDPFAHYLKNGCPQGPWNTEVIRPTADGDPPAGKVERVALHLHVFYPDLLDEILAALARNGQKPDLFVSIGDHLSHVVVADKLAGYGGRVVRIAHTPNRGRDIGPLLTEFSAQILESYDVFGHMHTKKSKDLADAANGQRWFRFLLQNLIGGDQAMMDKILGRMSADTGIGLVFPEDPHLLDWGKNEIYALDIARRMGGIELPEGSFNFPVGTMFWARTAALRKLFDVNFTWDDYPPEPLPQDGSMLHAMERMFPSIAKDAGYRYVVTHVPGLTR